jgi:hypothetical protein
VMSCNGVLGALYAVALGLAAATPAAAQGGCSEMIPADAAPIDLAHPVTLLGTWDILLVDTASRPQPSIYRQLRLRLDPPDSVQHRLWPKVTLVGQLAAPLIAPVHRSIDPTGRPEIALSGDLLQLGGFGVLDGAGSDALQPVASDGESVWGAWRQSRGFEVVLIPTDSGPVPIQSVAPQGYFCGRRVAADSQNAR